MNKTGLLAVVVLMASVTTADAVVPATLEQVFCAATSVVVGTVVSAESRDCRLVNPRYRSMDKYCARVVRIKILITGLLENGNDLRSGEVVEGDGQFRNDLPMDIGGKKFPMNEMGGGNFEFPATGKPVLTSEARKVLLDKQFIFGLRTTDAGPVFVSQAWPMTYLPWVTETLTNPGCAVHQPGWHPSSRPQLEH